MSVTPPEELTYGKVVGRFLLSVADTTDDPDRVPDARAAQGLTVTLTPKTVVQRVEGASPVTVLRSSTTCTVGPDGWLHDPAGAAGVWLVTGVYTVSYKATGLAGFSLPSQHTIEVTAEHTDEAPLDLTTALPYTPPDGVTVQTVQLPTGASAGKVLGWTASGAAWVTPDEAGAHTHEPEEVTGLAAVASSGSYNDLTDTPSIPATASDVGAADAEHTHPAEDITGLATVATSGSYDDLDDKPSIPSTPGDIGAAASSHTHGAGDVTSGTFDAARIPNLPASKVTSGTFDEARIPNLPASKITSGTIAPARLGSGTADNTKFLRGDGTWATPEGGGGGGSTGWRRYQPGRWYGATRMYGTHNNFAMAADVMDLTPLAIDAPTEIDRLAISVWTPGEAGSFMRVGVYATTHLWPTGAPLADVTLSLASTGTKQATVSLTLQPGFYWLAGVTSDTTARVRGYNQTGHVLMDIGHTAADSPRYGSDLLRAVGVSAAAPLPSSPEVSPRTMSDALVITFRVAE